MEKPLQRKRIIEKPLQRKRIIEKPLQRKRIIDIRADVRTDIRIDIRADVRTDMRTELEQAPLLSRGLRGNQDGEAVGRWHTAAVAYCRLRAPAADQCLKKKSAHTDTGAKPEG